MTTCAISDTEVITSPMARIKQLSQSSMKKNNLTIEDIRKIISDDFRSGIHNIKVDGLKIVSDKEFVSIYEGLIKD